MLLKRLGAFFLDIFEIIFFALAIFAFLYLLVLRPHRIQGTSMHPTFPDRQYLLTERVTYYLNEPKRGDIVVFRPPVSEDEFIKRIIALPGEKISIRNGRVYINGKALEEKYLSSDVYTSSGKFLEEGMEYVVPAGHYIVFGDNRPHSSDSRAWGAVEKKSIAGRAWLVYWPINNFGTVPKINYGF